MGDERQYETFFGIDVDDWSINWGTLGSHHKLLVKNYISEDTSCASVSKWQSTGSIFLYPHNIKHKYFLEGVVEGQVTFTSEGARVKSFLSDYRVSVIKIKSSPPLETTLATTGVISVNDVFNWTAPGVGDFIVYPYWMDVYLDPKEIGEGERLGIKIEWNVTGTSTATAWLSHDNWAQGEDLKITLPLMLG